MTFHRIFYWIFHILILLDNYILYFYWLINILYLIGRYKSRGANDQTNEQASERISKQTNEQASEQADKYSEYWTHTLAVITFEDV